MDSTVCKLMRWRISISIGASSSVYHQKAYLPICTKSVLMYKADMLIQIFLAYVYERTNVGVPRGPCGPNDNSCCVIFMSCVCCEL